MSEISNTIDEQKSRWMSLAGVEGIGEGEQDGSAVIVVYTSVDGIDAIPAELNGIRIVQRVVGEIRKQIDP